MRHYLLLAALFLTLAAAPLPARAAAFTIQLTPADFTAINPVFSNVQNFLFQIDFSSPLVAGASYDNSDLAEVRYDVRGQLSTNPATPSGFSAFALNRTASGEGVISPADWVMQGSSISFEIAATADLSDGLQAFELVSDSLGILFELDAREFERLDRARYHPPQLLLRNDFTGLLQNSNNSSGSTGTTNPATGLTVDVDFGEEYITDLAFDPFALTLVVPEPGTGALLATGLVAVAARGRRRRAQPHTCVG